MTSDQGEARTAPKRDGFRRTVRALASVRLAIGLLVALALASIFAVLLGEWIPPGQTDAFYIHRFGERAFRAYRLLGLLNPYGSWWFSSLLALLGLSMTVCSIRRLRSTVTLAFRADLRVDPAQVNRSPLHTKISLPTPPERAQDRVKDLLRRKRYRISEDRTGPRRASYASRGGIGRLGALLTHIGILLLLVAGILVGTWSYRATQYGATGDILEVPDRSFRVRVDAVDLETTPTGAVKDYFSTLTVLDPDSVLTKTIEVNDPLHYDGMDIYQSEFTGDPKRIMNARIWVTDRETGHQIADAWFPFQERARVADLDLWLRVDRFVSDFIIQPGGRIGSRSDQHKNPAAKIAVYTAEDTSAVSEQWLFLQYPEIHMKETEHHRFRLVDYTPVYITGLDIARIPARGLVWSGFGMCTLGIFLAFYLVHRRIWVVVEPDADDRCTVTIGGSANKNRDTFEREFETFRTKMEGGG